MERRKFLVLAVGAALAAAGVPGIVGGRNLRMNDIRRLREDWQTFLPPEHGLDLGLDPVERSKAEWQQQLSPAAFDVLRRDGTERAGTSPLNAEKRDGVYLCAGCRLPLFTSAMKYESGTGWPSFFTHIPDHLGTSKDFKLIWPRTEYHCIRCGGHQGHVFDDGPQPTGQRWCNNGVALEFLPKAG